MLDELTKFVRDRSPEFARYSFDQVKGTLEAFSGNTLVATDDAGRIRGIAIFVERGSRLHFTTVITDGKRQANFKTFRQVIRALKKDIEFLTDDGTLRVLKNGCSISAIAHNRRSSRNGGLCN